MQDELRWSIEINFCPNSNVIYVVRQNVIDFRAISVANILAYKEIINRIGQSDAKQYLYRFP